MMITAPIPKDEDLRLEALHALNIIGAPADVRLEFIVEFAAQALDAPIGLITLIDADYQWFMAAYGLDAKGTPRYISFCGHAICDNSECVFEVINAKEDVRFSDNPLVVDSPLIRSYISYVLKTDCGKNIATLCVIDNLPRKFTDINIQMLKLLGCMVENIIHNRYHLDGIKHKFD